MEAVAYGAAFPVAAYAAGENILHIDLPPLPLVSPRPENEAQYVRCVADRVADLPRTRALACELQTMLWAIDREWPSTLQGVYSKIDVLPHTPGPIPAARCSFDQDHQLLAALKPFHPPREIHARYPWVESMKLNLTLALQGAWPLRDALAYEWLHLRNFFLRKLRRAFVRNAANSKP
jgi:hypothetical protein